MSKTFIVDLDNGHQYEVEADYSIEVNEELDSVGCSLYIHSVRPTKKLDVVLTDKLMSEIESALAYKIVDEYNDLDDQSEYKEYLC